MCKTPTGSHLKLKSTASIKINTGGAARPWPLAKARTLPQSFDIMNINEIDESFERQARYRIGCQAKRRLYARPIAVWWQGWDAAIRWVKRMDKAISICTHCKKVIRDVEDFCTDSDGNDFCAECYDKIFKEDK